MFCPGGGDPCSVLGEGGCSCLSNLISKINDVMENIFQSRPLFCVSTFFGLFVQDGGMRAAETVVAVGGDPGAGPSSDQVQHVGGGGVPEPAE